jgi:GT2 family glycosyltransferase
VSAEGGVALPKVSVIVPVYNGADEIGTCVAALLAQDYPAERLEIIIVDNGSTDTTAEVVRNYGVTLADEREQVGSYAARNKGVAVASGEILGFTDADCLPSPDWVKTAVAAFADPAVHVVGGEVLACPPETAVERFLARREFLSHRHSMQHPFKPYFQTANVFARRSVFERIGAFNGAMISGGDVDFSWRAQIAGLGPIRFVPEAEVEHRHRTDVRELLRQQFKWGLGSGGLSRKYRAEMGPVRGRISRNGLWRIAGALVRLIRSLPGALPGAAGRERLREAWWDLQSTVCWECGYLVGLYRPQAARNARL